MFVMKQADCYERGELSAHSNTHASTVVLTSNQTTFYFRKIKLGDMYRFMAFINISRNIDIIFRE